MEEEAAACESSRELCNSLLSKKEWTSSVNFLESTPLDKVPGSELCQHASHLPSFPSESVSKQRHCSGANGPSRVVPTPEKTHVQRKSGQMSISGRGCHKRPQIALLEDTKGPVVVDDMKDPSDKLESHLTKIDSQEKAHLSRQKNNFSSKRGDRRNSKVSTRAKYDSFSVKASLASFSSAAAGNNFFGLYGLKTDVHDITKLVDDLSLNDLLQGAYECPSLGKDRGKKATNTTERILHSVRKACSILQLPRSAQIQNFADIDSCSNEKMPTCQSSSISTVGNGDNGDSSTTDISLSNKLQDSSNKSETPANLLNFSFDQPKDTLERLTLPPPKDLESLLLDAAKPAVSSRNASEPRPGKQISRWPSLPQFPWSHTFNGHCRTNSDAVKLLTIEHCPKVLAAAQTLCEIAACNSRLNRDGMIMKWPKKPTQKVMKARKSKSNEKHEEMFASSTSTRNGDQILASKRPKLSTSENKEDLAHINGVRKGPINWSTPKSSRSSAKLSVRDSTAYIVKQSCMMPPPAKVLNRTCNGQQKVRKLMRMDWSWECDRQD
ncbi:hypothetical protein GH714_037364 [Hevea brasiliensis]|uniref:Uncharacterized protein n=1 Tax=Hevea brasiliensis TaxID=3981 RepID=A0A6A6N7D7_HEVBR|nr:hypothetical protein GH714_037364 [Hevea brasiliensis]